MWQCVLLSKTSQKAEQQKGTRLISTRGRIINQQGKCTDEVGCVISDLYLVCDLRFSSFFKQILKILTTTRMILQHPPRPNIFAVSQVARLPPPSMLPPNTLALVGLSQSHYPLPQRDSRPRKVSSCHANRRSSTRSIYE